MGAVDEQIGLPIETLMQRWAKIVADPVLADLLYKIEIDQWGDIRMTPTASPRHMRVGFTLARALEAVLGGAALQEGAVATPQGVLTADVVWCSADYVARHRDVFVDAAPAMPDAPEICVEVVSPSNALPKLKHEIDAYLAAGAIEGWIVLEDLSIRVFDRDGEQEQSHYKVDLSDWRRGLA
jgi:Uma2 family endonuclease